MYNGLYNTYGIQEPPADVILCALSWLGIRSHATEGRRSIDKEEEDSALRHVVCDCLVYFIYIKNHYVHGSK